MGYGFPDKMLVTSRLRVHTYGRRDFLAPHISGLDADRGPVHAMPRCRHNGTDRQA